MEPAIGGLVAQLKGDGATSAAATTAAAVGERDSGSRSGAIIGKGVTDRQTDRGKQLMLLENQLRLQYQQRMRWERPLSKEAVKYLAAQFNVDPDDMVRLLYLV
jgi:hypothetical protein